MATLQQQVQQHLQNTGISLRELSRRSGVSHTTIGKILRGGEYKNSTADALRIAIKPKTLDAAVEQLAAQCVNADLIHHADWDTDLQCAKYRRVMALEKELNDEKRNFAALEQVHDHVAGNLKSCENALIEAHETITKLEQQLNDANTAYLSSKSQHERDLQRLNDAQDKLEYMKWLAREDGRKLQDYQAQLDSLQVAYDQQIDDEREMLAQIDTLFVERANMRTEYSLMRLRVYVWSLIAALVLVLVSGLVVWGGV